MLKLNLNYRMLSCVTALTFTLFSCGDKKTESTSAPYKGKVESAFFKAAQTNKIPYRYMLAAAWVESQMSSVPATSYYLDNSTSDTASAEKGIILAQTAFGIPAAKLGLAVSSELTFEDQITAYGKWVRQNIDDTALELEFNPTKTQDKFNWIWKLAELHRDNLSGPSYSRSIRAIFAKEFIKVLNEGFVWQDPNSEDIIKLKPEVPALKVEDLSTDAQDLIYLTQQQPPEVDSALFLRLGLSGLDNKNNVPTHVRVIHCPLSLSACLELQNQKDDQDIRLEAHYIIPNSNEFVKQPLQVSKHHNAVRLTDSSGRTNYINNAVVIMLTGNSGRLDKGYREPANPTWISKWQLEQMGALIQDVCLVITNGDPTKQSKCTTIGEGVQFQTNGVSESNRWGDIADFDPVIFSAYIDNPGGLAGSTAFDRNFQGKVYQAGQKIPLTLTFRPNVQEIRLERLIRCPDKKVIWDEVESKPVRSINQMNFEQTVYDSGPNEKGNHFYRAKVYGADQELLGWDVIEVLLTNFETHTSTRSPDECFRKF